MELTVNLQEIFKPENFEILSYFAGMVLAFGFFGAMAYDFAKNVIMTLEELAGAAIDLAYSHTKHYRKRNVKTLVCHNRCRDLIERMWDGGKLSNDEYAFLLNGIEGQKNRQLKGVWELNSDG